MKINWVVKKWSALIANEIYFILRLRSEVFVVEQDCVYQDIDKKDLEAIHIMGYFENKLIAYSRIFNKKEYFKETSFGRAIVKEKYRGTGLGHELVAKSLVEIKNNYGTNTVKISAQAHLKKFYSEHGFVTKGKEYLEDGIPHVAMYLNII